MPHQKAVPMDAIKNVAAFAGKHKVMVIGGAAVIGVGALLYMRNQSPGDNADPGVAYTGAYSPISSGMSPMAPGGGGGSGLTLPGSGGGTLIPDATAGGTTNANPTPVSAPTNIYTGAFGDYSGLAADLAATLDLARQDMEYGYNQTIYTSTMDYDAVLASMNLGAYQTALSYGSNAAATNASLLSNGISSGWGYSQIVDFMNGLFQVNPITPTTTPNLPGYANLPYTFGTGTSQNTGVQNVNQPQTPISEPGPYVSQLPVSTAPVTPNYQAYLTNNPDVAAAAQVEIARGVWQGDAASYAAYHYSHYGQAEGRVL